MADLDWTPSQVAQMLCDLAELLEHQSDAVFRDPEVRRATLVLRLLLDSRLNETQCT